MAPLKSLADALKIYNSRCERCINFWGDNTTTLSDVRRTGEAIIFGCKRGDTIVTTPAFEITERDFAPITEKIRLLLKSEPASGASYQEVESFLKKSDALQREIGIYACFAPRGKDLVINEGYCRYCLKTAPITLRDYRVWTKCEPCAMVVVDSAD